MSVTDPTSGVVLTSRVRLARNVAKTPFPHLLSAQKAQQVVERVQNALPSGQYALLWSQQMQDAYRQYLIEEHLVSRDWAESEHGALLLKKDQHTAIMLMEEDHLRIQCMLEGLALRAALEEAQTVSQTIERQVPFARTEKLGYLTACPSNVGTGMRASVLLHLPALVLTQQIGPLMQALKDEGFAVRGIYGEGSEAVGNLFQISNRISLGKEETAITAEVTQQVLRICQREAQAGEQLRTQNGVALEDRVYRAYGLLQQARLMAQEEFMQLWSDAMLGSRMGMLPLATDALYRLCRNVQPGHIQNQEQRQPQQRPADQIRATMCRKATVKQREMMDEVK